MDKFLLPNHANKSEKSCSACNQPITGSSLVCGVCLESYHPICASASSSKPAKPNDWKCPKCRVSEPRNCNQNTPALTTDRLDSPSANTTGSRAFKRAAIGSPDQVEEGENSSQPNIATELRYLRIDMSEIKSALQLLTEGIAKCTTRQNEFDSRIQALEEKDAIISSLKEELHQLKEQFSQQSQAALSKEIEILGVNETANESLDHIVMVTATKIGVNLAESEIDTVFRAGPKSTRTNSKDLQPPRPIIVRLVRKGKRDEVLKAAKVRRHNTALTSSDLNLVGPPRKIYINEHLTKANRLLFRDARVRARESGFRFCWVNNGRVHLRRDEGKPAVPISNYSELDRILPARRSEGQNESQPNPSQRR